MAPGGKWSQRMNALGNRIGQVPSAPATPFPIDIGSLVTQVTGAGSAIDILESRIKDLSDRGGDDDAWNAVVAELQSEQKKAKRLLDDLANENTKLPRGAAGQTQAVADVSRQLVDLSTQMNTAADHAKNLLQKAGKARHAPPQILSQGIAARQSQPPTSLAARLRAMIPSTTAPIGRVPKSKVAPQPILASASPRPTSAPVGDASPKAPSPPSSPATLEAPTDAQAMQVIKQQLQNSLNQLQAGSSLHQAAEDLLQHLGADPNDAQAIAQALQEIETKIQDLKQVLTAPGVTDEERNAIVQALTHPTQTVQTPNTPATKEATEILKDINARLAAIKTPPSLRKYGKGMILRPVAEVGGAVVEGGLATLILNSVVYSLTGFAPAATVVGHAITWTTASLGWNLAVNSNFKAMTLQEIANRGSVVRGLGGLLKHPRTGSYLSSRMLTTPLRIASIMVLLGGGVTMLQKIFGDVDDSARNAQLLAAPLKEQQVKFQEYKDRMLKFAPIPSKILQIAKQIEAGKGSAPATPSTPPDPQVISQLEQAVADAKQELETAHGTKTKKDDAQAQAKIAATQKHLDAAKQPTPATSGKTGAPYSSQEKDEMKQQLIPLFQAAGLDPSLVSQITFADPVHIGEGPVFEFKNAITTGDLSKLRELNPDDLAKLRQIFPDAKNTAEMVMAIRTRMGLEPGHKTYEQRVSEIIHAFFASKELARIYGDLDRSLEIAAQIEAQGKDVKGTSIRAILKGDPPISISAVEPYNKAILDSRDALRQAAQEQVSTPIKKMFGVLDQALGQIGGKVTLVGMPPQEPDMTPLQNLQHLIEDMVKRSADVALKERAVQSSVEKTLLQFVPGMPGSTKALGMERYVARQMATYMGGYRVEVNGAETNLYRRKFAGERGSFDPGVARLWEAYLWKGNQIDEARNIFPQVRTADISKMSDAELGSAFREPIKNYIASIQTQGRQKEPQLRGVVNSYESLLHMSDEHLGTTIREQGVAQLKTQHAPLVYPPSVWDMIIRGTPPMKTAVDFAGWAREASEADPSFGNTVFKDISQLSDEALGSLARQHVTMMVQNLTGKIKTSGSDALLEQMVSKYNPLAVTADERLGELGRKVREQIVYQIQHTMSPVAVYPDGEWAAVLNPALAAALEEKIDPAEWDMLPPEQSKEIFGTYLKAAQTEAALFATIPVLLLSLGGFLLAMRRVAQKNSNLLKVKEKNLDAWKHVEGEMLEAIQHYNDLLSTLPFFSALPPLEPYMLLASLRKLGEDYQDDLKQDLTTWESIKHHAKATLAPGPYAESIAEIFAMERLTERVTKETDAQRKLADIIAPGLYEMIELIKQKPHTQLGATVFDDYLTYANVLDLTGTELFRNAARGHLRFREAVLTARINLAERMAQDIVKTPAVLDLRSKIGTPQPITELTKSNLGVESESALFKLLILNAESQNDDVYWNTYQETLERLDTDALGEEMLNRYRDPILGRRAEIAKLATEVKDNENSFTVPPRGEPLKEFSIISGIQRDLEKLLRNTFPVNYGLPEIGAACTRAYEQTHPGEQCNVTVSLDEDGELMFTAQITAPSGQEQIACPAIIFAQALDDEKAAVQAFVSTVEASQT